MSILVHVVLAFSAVVLSIECFFTTVFVLLLTAGLPMPTMITEVWRKRGHITW